MAKKHKGMTVGINHDIRQQLLGMLRNMEISIDEANDVLKKTMQTNANLIQNEINSALEKHVLTGETIEYAIVPKIETTKMASGREIAKIDVGVRLSGNLQDMLHGNGGYASLLLDYGTPKKRVQKNKKRKYKHALTEPVQPQVIGSAIRRGRRRWEQEAQEEFNRIMKERLGK